MLRILSKNRCFQLKNLYALKKQYSTSYELNLKVKDVSLNKYITRLQNEYETLIKDPSKSRRLAELQPIINILEERKDIVENITNLSELLQENDKDLRKLAEDEKTIYEEKIKAIDADLYEVLLPVNKEDYHDSIVLEINAGVGGQEAMLFANELFNMYCNFIEYKGWNYQVVEYLTTDLGGIRHASILVDGKMTFKYFKYEAGVHRVQRIPTTEKSGRTHTSTVSVTALPQPSEIDIQINNKDLKIETKRATGAGGQHVNTTDSAVRIVHLPTGTAVECQIDRSQIKNREFALQRLKAKLYQIKMEKQQADLEATKKSQVRSNFRNEKIRTYNFSQDRITDHRLQNSNIHNLKVFLNGGAPLEELINKLHVETQKELLLQILTEI